MKRWMLLITALLAVGCVARQPVVEARIPTLTKEAELPAHVGEVVTIRGKFFGQLKQPQILSVDVDLGEFNPQMKYAQATGILERIVVTREDIEADVKRHGSFANRGPGVFYRLREVHSIWTAQVVPYEKN